MMSISFMKSVVTLSSIWPARPGFLAIGIGINFRGEELATGVFFRILDLEFAIDDSKLLV